MQVYFFKKKVVIIQFDKSICWGLSKSHEILSAKLEPTKARKYSPRCTKIQMLT